MNDKESVIEKIYAAFGENRHPGKRFLQGSFEGSEPYDEVGPFGALEDWRGIDPAFLDAHYSALSFFSEAGLRFFLPAYLIADLQGQLKTADPLFHLTHGFFDLAVESVKKDPTFVIKTGKTQLINPRRYGAATFYDYARYRLSIFTREEAGAIVAYLQYKREAAEFDSQKEEIDSALGLFWLERARSAPAADRLQQYLAEQEAYLAALNEEDGDAL